VMFVKAEGRATVSPRWKILSSVLYRCHGIAYLRARQATKRASRLHPSVSANRRQAAANWTGLGARTEA
jgi:hypothetical protein